MSQSPDQAATIEAVAEAIHEARRDPEEMRWAELLAFDETFPHEENDAYFVLERARSDARAAVAALSALPAPAAAADPTTQRIEAAVASLADIRKLVDCSQTKTASALIAGVIAALSSEKL